MFRYATEYYDKKKIERLEAENEALRNRIIELSVMLFGNK